MENNKKHRYSLLYTTQDLLEAWCLVISFGSTITHQSRTVIQAHPNKESALLALFDIETKKRQSGYTYSDLAHPELFHLRPQTIKEVLAGKKLASQNIAILSHAQLKNNQLPHPDQQELFI